MPPLRDYRPWYAVAALAVAAAVLWPATGVRFMGDDFIWVQEASTAGLLDCFRRGYFEFLRPTSELFWLLGWRLSGLDPAGYHLLILGLHLATALLLGRWVEELTGEPWAGFAALVLFLGVPDHREPLSWLAAGNEVLAGFFVLATLVAYRRWRLGQGWRWLAAALLALALALGSKESAACVLPGLILVELLLVPEAPWAERLLGLAPLLLVGVAGLAALALALRADHGYSTWPTWGTPALWLAYTGRALLTLQLVGLAPAWAPAAAVALGAAGLAAAWRRDPAAAFHLAWLPASVLPYAWSVPDLAVQERYFYLSSLALAGLGGALVARFRARAALPAALLAGLGLAVLGGGLSTMAADRGLPQPERASLAQALAGRPPGSAVHVYWPRNVEAHPLYACALYGGLPLGELRRWDSVLGRAEIARGERAVYWDKLQERFQDTTADWRRAHADMVRQGRAPVPLDPAGRPPVVRLIETSGEEWAPVGLERRPDGSWTTPGLEGSWRSPRFEVPPFAIQVVAAELEVLEGAPTRAWLDWCSEARPAGQGSLEVAAPLAPGVQWVSFSPGDRRAWWTQGRILALHLVPAGEPATVRLRRIALWGPRKSPRD